MIFDYENKTIQIKIVFYGPAMSGKTTSIKYLFYHFNKSKRLKSIDSTVGRTLFFDFGVLEFQGSEWSLKFLIYSATGQDFYASTRPATLRGVDGIIFVLDSQIKCLDRNLRSWEELRYFFGNELYEMPLLIACNKYDIDNGGKLKEEEILNYIESFRFKNLLIEQTIAITGVGIISSFEKLVNSLFPNITLGKN